MVGTVAPHLRDALERGQVTSHPRAKEQDPRVAPRPTGEDAEPSRRRARLLDRDHLHGEALVAAQLLLGDPPQLARRSAVVTKQTLHTLADAVRRIVRVYQENTAPHTAQNQSRRQTGGTATHDRDVERPVIGLHLQKHRS